MAPIDETTAAATRRPRNASPAVRKSTSASGDENKQECLDTAKLVVAQEPKKETAKAAAEVVKPAEPVKEAAPEQSPWRTRRAAAFVLVLLASACAAVAALATEQGAAMAAVCKQKVVEHAAEVVLATSTLASKAQLFTRETLQTAVARTVPPTLALQGVGAVVGLLATAWALRLIIRRIVAWRAAAAATKEKAA